MFYCTIIYHWRNQIRSSNVVFLDKSHNLIKYMSVIPVYRWVPIDLQVLIKNYMFYIFTVMNNYMVFLMHIIYSFSSLRWFTTYRFCPKQLLMLLRVTPLIQSILQSQEYDFNMLVDHSGARYTTWVSAVNRKLSAIKHALRAKKCWNTSHCLLSKVQSLSKQALSVIRLQVDYF